MSICLIYSLSNMNAFTIVKLLLQLYQSCYSIVTALPHVHSPTSQRLSKMGGGGSPPPPLVSTTDRNQIGMIE